MKKICLLFLIMFCCVGCDQVSKHQATTWLKDAEPMSFLGNTVRLQYTENIGATLGLGSELPAHIRYYVFTLGVGSLLVLGLTFLLLKPLKQATLLFGALIISGGFGNFYDRVFNNGAVVDFLNVGIGSVRTGIFNVADIVILVGALGIVAFSSDNEAQHQSR